MSLAYAPCSLAANFGIVFWLARSPSPETTSYSCADAIRTSTNIPSCSRPGIRKGIEALNSYLPPDISRHGYPQRAIFSKNKRSPSDIFHDTIKPYGLVIDGKRSIVRMSRSSFCFSFFIHLSLSMPIMVCLCLSIPTVIGNAENISR